MIQKIKELVVRVIGCIKAFVLKAWNAIRKFTCKWWAHIVNLLVLFVAYDHIDIVDDTGAFSLVGLWIFFLLAYYLFWKIFRGETLFEKDE